jgi:hypothetical protein
VGPRAGLDTGARGKICQGSNPGRPVCSQTLLTELSNAKYKFTHLESAYKPTPDWNTYLLYIYLFFQLLCL